MAQKMRTWNGLPDQVRIPLGTIRCYSYGLVNLMERMLLQDGKRRPSAKEIEAECTKARCEVESAPMYLND